MLNKNHHLIIILSLTHNIWVSFPYESYPSDHIQGCRDKLIIRQLSFFLLLGCVCDDCHKSSNDWITAGFWFFPTVIHVLPSMHTHQCISGEFHSTQVAAAASDSWTWRQVEGWISCCFRSFFCAEKLVVVRLLRLFHLAKVNARGGTALGMASRLMQGSSVAGEALWFSLVALGPVRRNLLVNHLLCVYHGLQVCLCPFAYHCKGTETADHCCSFSVDCSAPLIVMIYRVSLHPAEIWDSCCCKKTLNCIVWVLKANTNHQVSVLMKMSRVFWFIDFQGLVAPLVIPL